MRAEARAPLARRDPHHLTAKDGGVAAMETCVNLMHFESNLRQMANLIERSQYLVTTAPGTAPGWQPLRVSW